MNKDLTADGDDTVHVLIGPTELVRSATRGAPGTADSADSVGGTATPPDTDPERRSPDTPLFTSERVPGVVTDVIYGTW
jgi:hypothetical protein